MQSQLKRAINLIKKTGDKLLVADVDEKVYALMNLDEYEDLLLKKSEVRGLTEEELIDKINRDVAIWKSENRDLENYSSGPSARPDFAGNYQEFTAQAEEEDDFSGMDEVIARKKSQIRFGGNKWTIPEDRKEKAEEVIEEDQQYLEEVPF